MRSMRDVARLAEVSIATVSAVLNGKGTVSAGLVTRVEEAMRALDYQPDQVARSLRMGRTNVIGMIVPDISNPFFSEVLRAVEEHSEREGYSVILCDSNEDSGRERKHLSTLYARRVDGVILASSVSQIAHDRLTLRRFPLVFIDGIPSGVTEGVVRVDNVGAAYLATRHLIDLQHERIAIVNGRLDRSVALDRMEGFRKAMQESGLRTPEEYVRKGDFHVESGYEQTMELMRSPSPPTAIFSCNNRMSLGVLRALGELGIRCPQQVSVVGFDDADWATSFNPRLTCVGQPTYEIGRRATEMLLQKITGGGNGEETVSYPSVVLDVELHIRESTAPPFLAAADMQGEMR